MKRLLFALPLLAFIAAALAYLSLQAPYRGFHDPVILDFPKGTSTQAMAKELAKNGVIRYSWQFLLARALGPGKRLQAGEYRFARADTPANILDRIGRGDVFYLRTRRARRQQHVRHRGQPLPLRFHERLRLPACARAAPR